MGTARRVSAAKTNLNMIPVGEKNRREKKISKKAHFVCSKPALSQYIDVEAQKYQALLLIQHEHKETDRMQNTNLKKQPIAPVVPTSLRIPLNPTVARMVAIEVADRLTGWPIRDPKRPYRKKVDRRTNRSTVDSPEPRGTRQARETQTEPHHRSGNGGIDRFLVQNAGQAGAGLEPRRAHRER